MTLIKQPLDDLLFLGGIHQVDGKLLHAPGLYLEVDFEGVVHLGALVEVRPKMVDFLVGDFPVFVLVQKVDHCDVLFVQGNFVRRLKQEHLTDSQVVFAPLRQLLNLASNVVLHVFWSELIAHYNWVIPTRRIKFKFEMKNLRY